jgi:hypothetical protein
MADEQTPQHQDDEREYEPPTLTVLGTVRQLTSDSEVTEVPK